MLTFEVIWEAAIWPNSMAAMQRQKIMQLTARVYRLAVCGTLTHQAFCRSQSDHLAHANLGNGHFATYLFIMSDPGPNPLVRLFLGGTAVGFAASAIFVATLWLWDVMGIASHAQGSDDAFLLLFILWFFNGLLFGAVQISYVVWQMGRSDG